MRVLFILFLLIASLRAQTSLESVRRAQTLLGADVWSRAIKVHNEKRGGAYPRIVHALVFELAGVLWFYTDVDGTQSFSLHHGQLEREKSDFGPLLRDIEPGFARWSLIEDEEEPVFAREEFSLRNGCFIESVAMLRERLARGDKVGAPRLLSYYIKTAAGVKGHTVLAYESGGGVEIFDPGRREQQFVFSRELSRDPLVLAQELDGGRVNQARYLSLRPKIDAENIPATSAVVS